jgi:hypothetical protein
MDNVISEQHTPNPLAAFMTVHTDLSIKSSDTLVLGEAALHTTSPALCRPDDTITDPGILRIGDAEISPRLPCL